MGSGTLIDIYDPTRRGVALGIYGGVCYPFLPIVPNPKAVPVDVGDRHGTGNSASNRRIRSPICVMEMDARLS